ncbi:MAG: c-type cytochrome [Alphaproteobacteria bacterium]|nr:c-type cytochrome [Alphaproteobacteria bacterium]
MRPVALPLLLAACATDPDAAVCASGLDLDADGVCDHDAADWTREASLPPEGHRANIFQLSDDDWAAAREDGLKTMSAWPITVSGLLLPYKPLAAFLDDSDPDPQKATLRAGARAILGFDTMAGMYDWLGLPPYSPADATGAFRTPYPEGQQAGDAMGAATLQTEWGEALTFSCAACHVSEAFGRTVVGLTNRKARANAFFHLAQEFFPDIPADAFAAVTGADDGELELFERTQRNLAAVGAVVPSVRGLDTSLAQVSLSLARREPDAWATFSNDFEVNPRPAMLESFVADSKPAVWWTLKYKTRWLADGSIVTGNPIFTNFLWNELGRATDLHELRTWLEDNREVADALTVAVFATEAPRWIDVLGSDGLDLEAARRGEAHFVSMCSSCHGTYDKGWDAPDAATRDLRGKLETTAVHYHDRTPVFDVGTDLQRAQGMADFTESLNRLEVSTWMKTLVEVQPGYVPPPLEGIWIRYPYLHNASVPTLCDLLSPADQRTPTFWLGPADDPATDFDAGCVGYPTGDAVPAAWLDDDDGHFDTTRPGLSNRGHDEHLLDAQGAEILGAADKADLIAYLKTL